jgi:hypothetical protein
MAMAASGVIQRDEQRYDRRRALADDNDEDEGHERMT